MQDTAGDAGILERIQPLMKMPVVCQIPSINHYDFSLQMPIMSFKENKVCENRHETWLAWCKRERRHHRKVKAAIETRTTLHWTKRAP